MLFPIASAALGAVFGGILTIVITIWVEYLRSPSLSLSLGEEPRDYPFPEGRPGGRRFWPIRCNGLIDLKTIERDKNQLWQKP
jgi:hypothetical protein